MLSLKAKTAVGGSGRSRSSAAAASPPSTAQSDSTTSAESRATPAEASAARYPFKRSTLASHSGTPAWPHAPVSERKQMLGRGATTERIRRGDRRHTLIEWFEWVNDDERVSGTREPTQRFARLLREYQQCAVCHSAGEAGEEIRRSVAEVQRRCQDDLQVMVIQLIRGSSDDPREVSASTSGSVIPTRNVRPPTRERALRLVEKPSSRTAPRTLSRVAVATSGRPFITRDTVAIDTPAVRATSRIVGRPVHRC